MILPLTHWRRGHHVRAPAPMVMLLRQGCPSGTPPALVSTTGASPSSRNCRHTGLLQHGHTPIEEEGPHREGAGPPLLWSSPCDARQGAASAASRKELSRHLPRSVGKREPPAPDLLPGEEGEGAELSDPAEDIPRRDLAGIWRVRRGRRCSGARERGLASG
jgi:hypothetical protein